jgi:hypothetical protein
MMPRMNSIDSPLLGLSQRLPPSNLQAEQALLGALLANNRAYERVSEYLSPIHFADPIHGRIFQSIARRIAPRISRSFCRRWSASSTPANMAVRFTIPGCGGS